MRRYPQLRSTPNLVAAIPSQGSAAVIQTSNRRRYPQLRGTLALVATLPSVGTPTAGSAFQVALVRNNQANGGYAS